MKRILLLLAFILIFVNLALSQEIWTYQAVVVQDNVSDNLCRFGTNSEATDEFDVLHDVPAPPPGPGNYIRAYFYHPEWDAPTGNQFSRDIRAPYNPNTVKTWTLYVQSNRFQESTISFSAINALPGGFIATVEHQNTLYNLQTEPVINFEYTGVQEFIITIRNMALPPFPFSLVGPDSGISVDETSVLFNWHAAREIDLLDEVTYELEYSLDPDFTAVTAVPAGTDTFITVNDLPDDSEIWWRVHALDTNTAGTFSIESWSLTTNIPDPPGSFSLISPANSSTINETPVTFSWTESIDPDLVSLVLYTLEISNDAEFTNPVSYFSADNNSRTVADLEEDQQYFWRVFAEDVTGLITYSDEEFDFTIQVNDPPSNFNLLEPQNFTNVIFNESQLFTWQESSDPDLGSSVRYDVYFHVIQNDTITQQFLDEVFIFDGITQEQLNVNMAVDLSDWYESWEVNPEVDWWVEAISETDTVQSNQQRMFYITDGVNVDDKDNALIPEAFDIVSAYPNPFNAEINLNFAIPEYTDLSVRIFDILGREIDHLEFSGLAPGYFSNSWKAGSISSGSYYLVGKTNKGWIATRKITFLK